jgi:hypothetical protein
MIHPKKENLSLGATRFRWAANPSSLALFAVSKGTVPGFGTARVFRTLVG